MFLKQHLTGFSYKNILGAVHRDICHAFGLMAQNALIEKVTKITFEGAAHRDINFSIAVRCTFKIRKMYYFYKYLAALPLL